MCCNSQIHDELKNMEESTCPFCDQLLVEGDNVVESCCSEQDIENKNGINVCINCGSIHGYVYVHEYINFYENMYRIRRKSVYHRKYHIENVLNSICYGNRVGLTHDQRSRIYKIFVEIDSILPLVNRNRKRLISTKFIIRQIFMLLGLHFEFIKVSKSRRTLEFYNRYWVKILLLRFDRIIRIIRE